uniref:Uncharacterized protein LOC100186669 n=1 Tax=Phallusia mammillata TaxID=59560 RepID=A0A6F9DJ55_9ASCI|nr:uncharacterized protein LOC100186669 [Phallusia mammillata]
MILVNNTTNGNQTGFSPVERHQQAPWLAATVLGCVCVLMSLWLCIAMLCYGIQYRKFSRRTSGFILYLLAFVAVASGLAFLISVLVSVNIGFIASESDVCNILTKFSVELLVTSNSLVYLFLWTKQATLYQSPALEHLQHRWIKVMSYTSVVLMVLGQHVAGMAFNVLNVFASTDFGCRYVDAYHKWPSLAASSVNAIGQALMLFLLLYPFHCANQRQGTKASMSIVKRTTVTTFICVLTDAVAGIANGIFVLSSNHLPLSIYGCSVTANLMAVLLTYETWRCIIVSPFGGSKAWKSRTPVLSVSDGTPVKKIRDPMIKT